tara:strand:+ start:2867 stop:4117 length:1251 start_codon:yes stop_codon:yes gene_type:complete
MTKMFESLGTNGHYSTPGAYHDQAAGYYTGGGFVMRQRNQTYQPIQVSLPHIGAGCNGIDAYFGGFSFMKGSQLVKMLKSMASQAPTYAMQLGLKVMSPTIENLLAQLRKKLMDINATMMEDCRLVEQTFAALAPKGSAFETHACQDVMSHSGGDSDWFGAREKCQSSHEREQVTQSLKEKNPDLMMGEYNLVWHVLQKMDKLDDAFRTFIQSAIGTVVSRKEGDALRLEFKEGKADDKTFLSAWLRGGETSMLVCNERDKCLAPSWVMHTLNPNEGMRYKIMNKIQVIRRKYITGKVLTEEEMSFLGDTVNLPVYRYIQVSAATGTEFMLMEAADFIAVTLLLSQFDKISSQILSNIESLQKIQMEDSVIESFKGNLQRTRLRLQDLLSTVNSGSVWRLTQMIQAHEKSLLAKEG